MILKWKRKNKRKNQMIQIIVLDYVIFILINYLRAVSVRRIERMK